MPIVAKHAHGAFDRAGDSIESAVTHGPRRRVGEHLHAAFLRRGSSSYVGDIAGFAGKAASHERDAGQDLPTQMLP